jgi:DNA ligase (NAD+)
MSIAIRDFFTDERNQRAIDVLLEAGVQVVAPKVSKALLLAGKTFVFTGTLQRFSGHEASQQVESLGAQATTSISGQTDYVVVGMDPGQKRDEAKAKGVQILTEEQFVSLMREAGAEV